MGFPFSLTAPKPIYLLNAGLIEMLTRNINYFKSKPVNLLKITILLDHGYHPEHLTTELKKIYPQILTKIKFELSEKPSKQQKEAQGQSGFVPVKARWVIEPSNSWMERCKILIKKFERTLDNATAEMNLCFIRLMINPLLSLQGEKRLSPCARWILAILNNLGFARRKPYEPIVPENYLPEVTKEG